MGAPGVKARIGLVAVVVTAIALPGCGSGSSLSHGKPSVTQPASSSAAPGPVSSPATQPPSSPAAPWVTTLIGRLFHVRYTLRGTSYLLHRIRGTPQVPVHRAAERDEAKIAAWRRQTWAKVRG